LLLNPTKLTYLGNLETDGTIAYKLHIIWDFLLHISTEKVMFALIDWLNLILFYILLIFFGLVESLMKFWFGWIPNFIREDWKYSRNRLGMSKYRFITIWKGLGLCPPFLSCTLFFLIYELMSCILKKIIYPWKNDLCYTYSCERKLNNKLNIKNYFLGKIYNF